MCALRRPQFCLTRVQLPVMSSNDMLTERWGFSSGCGGQSLASQGHRWRIATPLLEACRSLVAILWSGVCVADCFVDSGWEVVLGWVGSVGWSLGFVTVYFLSVPVSG